MEEIEDKIEDRSLDDKFYRIREEYDPALFVAFFYSGLEMDGVAFEIGWLCCMYHSLGLSQKLRVLVEPGYDWKETTPYIPSLFPSVSMSLRDILKLQY